MSEIINAYDLENLEKIIPMNRKEFYKEQIKVFKETGKSTKCAEEITILLFNECGELILQKRSPKKSNANKIDKSIGGHLKYGDSINFTAQIETLEELGISSIILEKEDNFDEIILKFKKYLEKSALIQYIDTKIEKVFKNFDGKKIEITYKRNFYVGAYFGSLKNIDGEVKGILFYGLDELKQEIKESSELFTNQLPLLIEEYEDLLTSFSEKIKLLN